MHRIAPGDHHRRGKNQDGGKNVKKYLFETHKPHYRYGAWAARSAASCASYLSPTASNFSFVMIAIFAILEVIFVDPGLHDGVNRAGFLTESAKNALEEVDVVTRGSARAVIAWFGLDGNRQGGTNSLAQLAGDTTLLAIGVTPQRMQPPEARRDRRLVFRVGNRELTGEEISSRQAHSLQQLEQKQAADVC